MFACCERWYDNGLNEKKVPLEFSWQEEEEEDDDDNDVILKKNLLLRLVPVSDQILYYLLASWRSLNIIEKLLLLEGQYQSINIDIISSLLRNPAQKYALLD